MSCTQAANTKPMREKDTNTRLGLNGLGLCATQYAVRVYGCGDIPGRISVIRSILKKVKMWAVCTRRRQHRKRPAASIRWKPDLDVFTDIEYPDEYYTEVLKRQAVVNAGLSFYSASTDGERL